MKTFHLPDLGEGLMEAEIVEWHVAVGDEIKADQPLVSVETAKAIVEVPSPRSGRITALFGAPSRVVEGANDKQAVVFTSQRYQNPADASKRFGRLNRSTLTTPYTSVYTRDISDPASGCLGVVSPKK